MIQAIQYADKNTYFLNTRTLTGEKDLDGYMPHGKIVRKKENDFKFKPEQFDNLAGHDNEAEILELLNKVYFGESFPSNGGEINTKDTAGMKVDRDNILADSNKYFIRRLSRWKGGIYNPATLGSIAFDKRVTAERRKCAGTPAYQKRMLDKWLKL